MRLTVVIAISGRLHHLDRIDFLCDSLLLEVSGRHDEWYGTKLVPLKYQHELTSYLTHRATSRFSHDVIVHGAQDLDS